MNKIKFYDKKKEEKKEALKKAKRESFYESLANGYLFTTNLF